MRNIRVLIVEDDEGISKCCSQLISRKFINVEVDAVGSVEDALKLFELNIFDLVITDLGLPELPGEHLIKWVKSTQDNTPVIAMSGTAKPDRAKGADRFIAKPFDVFKFINTVKEVLINNGKRIKEK